MDIDIPKDEDLKKMLKALVANGDKIKDWLATVPATITVKELLEGVFDRLMEGLDDQEGL